MADSESAILHFIIFNLKSRLDKSPGSHLQIFSTYQERQTGLPDIASLIGINFSPRNSFSALIRSGKRGSNPRPSAWEANALPTELLPQTTKLPLNPPETSPGQALKGTSRHFCFSLFFKENIHKF